MTDSEKAMRSGPLGGIIIWKKTCHCKRLALFNTCSLKMDVSREQSSIFYAHKLALHLKIIKISSKLRHARGKSNWLLALKPHTCEFLKLVTYITEKHFRITWSMKISGKNYFILYNAQRVVKNKVSANILYNKKYQLLVSRKFRLK